MCVVLVKNIWRNDICFLKLVQLRTRLLRGTEDISFKPPWRSLGALKLHMCSGGHGEDIVEFLKTPLLLKVSITSSQWPRSTYLCLREPEPNHDKCNCIEERVKAKGALRPHRLKHPRKGQREDRRPEVVRRHRPGHADFSVRKWEHLGGICEWHRTFSRRVKYVEKVNEEGDQAKVRSARVRNPETKAGGEQGPAHVRKSEKQQSTQVSDQSSTLTGLLTLFGQICRSSIQLAMRIGNL